MIALIKASVREKQEGSIVSSLHDIRKTNF